MRTVISIAIALWMGAAQVAASPFDVSSSIEPAVCAECHEEAVKAWSGSHHAKALQPATPASVLGKFDGTALIHAAQQTIFTREGDTFFATIISPGPLVEERRYKILYTFGVIPLQQYLVETEAGRLQALPWAWDTNSKRQGGERWFHLYPGDVVRPGDRLHWESPTQNWNGMCADCHSTGLTRNYDVAKDRFMTTAATLNVSCTSCHADATDHVRAMRHEDAALLESFKDVKRFLDSKGTHFEWDEGRSTAINKGARHQQKEISVCASCHSIRAPLTKNIDPRKDFLDQFIPSLLDEVLYHPDGQILDEVYVWGSFMQSKMAAAGVTCTNCHNAHSLGLKRKGNSLCTTCHAATVFDTRDHHHHAPGTTGANCTNCHMPETTYMVTDPRRDHSFKIPRPDLSVTFGTPNACTTCHTDMKNETAAAHITEWHGTERPDATAVLAVSTARAHNPAARGPLLTVIDDEAQPAITRATALSLISNVADDTLISAAISRLGDPEPLIRIGAIRALSILPAEQRASYLMPLFADTVKAVRIEAATALLDVPLETLSGDTLVRFQAARVELLEANEEVAWRPEGHFNRALIHQANGDIEQAMATYKSAIEIDPAFTPSYINLSELMRAQSRDKEALEILLLGLQRVPDDAALEHALGLALIREGKRADAMIHLERAVDLAPQTPRFAYVNVVALHSVGKIVEAQARLETALARHPYDPDLLTFGLSLANESEDRLAMRRYALRLVAIFPNDPSYKDLVARLKDGR